MSLGLEFNPAGINIITESQSPDNNHCKATFFAGYCGPNNVPWARNNYFKGAI